MQQPSTATTIGQKCPALIGEVLDSLSPVKILLSEIIVRLKLKQKPFEMYPAASDDEIRALWESLLEVDHTLSYII